MTIEQKDGKIRFTDTNGINYSTWLLMLNRINHLGYDLPSADSLKDYFDRHTFLNKDQSVEVLKVLNNMHDEPEISEKDVQKINDKAISHFGETTSLNLAGYILTDGRLLKMSYTDWDRDRDHREIHEILDVDTSDDQSAGMIKFMTYGNIRITSRCLDMAKRPTEKQRKLIARYINRAKQSDYTWFGIDISNNSGFTVKSLEYDFPNYTTVINDIDDYFDSLMIPEK